MDGYYDHHPLVNLDKPLALAGYLADESRLVGYQLASLTGLPVIDLDRKIEHHAGKSIWDLIWNDGESRYRQLEQQYLESVLRERPCGVLSLGDGTLIDDDNRRRVLAEAHLVVLDLDLPNCYWRLKSGPRGDREFWHPLVPGPVERPEQLRPFHAAREPGFAEAPHRIELRGKRRSDVVDQLQALIPDL